MPTPEITLVSRSTEVGAIASLVAAMLPLDRSTGSVSWVQLDLLDATALCCYLGGQEADIFINCASLRSPWAHATDMRPLSKALGELGFGAQLCAQVPPIYALMSAIEELGLSIPVINCSFPDAINPMLAATGKAPLCGIGNAGMLHRVLSTRLPGADVRVTAHHSLVQLLLTGSCLSYLDADCHIEVDGVHLLWSELMRDTVPMARTVELNWLAATHAIDVIEALLFPQLVRQTSLPGPLGVAGGYPCRIQEGRLEMMPSPTLSPLEMISLNERAARRDGIAGIGDDGTVHFTYEMQEALPDSLGFLGASMHPSEALARYQRLDQVLASSTGVGLSCESAGS
ncbi:hypothetical protein [Pseudarthrobacter sp. L1SW]|uniref:hypothetical protein n=1 Tax=Pseudarthrobacter sp. L1SW TaxID=2851598 RepID=UPI001E39ACD9|nr:hypothetical protein [Pseudarthrobacter sp. L1SW]UEL30066.1 hypothetical protein KTR40_08250 [Pseudarthrobacter sp. L1SW]